MPRKKLQEVHSDKAEEEAALRWWVRPTVGIIAPVFQKSKIYLILGFILVTV